MHTLYTFRFTKLCVTSVLAARTYVVTPKYDKSVAILRLNGTFMQSWLSTRYYVTFLLKYTNHVKPNLFFDIIDTFQYLFTLGKLYDITLFFFFEWSFMNRYYAITGLHTASDYEWVKNLVKFFKYSATILILRKISIADFIDVISIVNSKILCRYFSK